MVGPVPAWLKVVFVLMGFAALMCIGSASDAQLDHFIDHAFESLFPS